MRPAIAFLVVLLSFLAPNDLSAQSGIPSDGREFFLGLVFPSFIRQPTNGPDPQYNVTLLITSAGDNDVSLSYFDVGGSQVGGKDLKLSAHQGVQVQLDYTHFNTLGTSELVQYGTCHVTAKAPISIQVVSMGSCSGGGYQALPLQCWGKQYVIQSYNDNPSGLGGVLSTGVSRGFFQIVASEDGTQVTITPSTTTAGGHTGVVSGVGAKNVPVPFTIGLARGQVYTVFGAGKDPSNDLTGSLVESTKPVAVLAGHENAYPAGSMDLASTTEERDFMIEQLIPVECWDTTGYVAIPLVDTKPATSAGAGGEMRVVVYPGAGNAVAYNSGSGTTGTISTPNYSSASSTGVTTAMRYFDKNKKPFGVMMYDQRQQGTSSPYPAPSMMGIMPRSRWKSDYHFFVPPTKYQVYERYLYIVAPKLDWNNRKIMLGVNGTNPSPILSGGATIQKMYNSVPGDTSLVAAVLIPASNGAYYLSDAAVSLVDSNRHGTFAAYFSGACFDKRNKMPDIPNDSDDYFEFANPLGMAYGNFSAVKPRLSATVDNLCGNWNICIQDSGDSKTGIRYIELLNYQQSRWNTTLKTTRNVRFATTVDSLGDGGIVLPGTDKVYCLNVSQINAADSTYAQIEAYDNSGASILIDLTAVPSLKPTATGSISQISPTNYLFSTTPADSSHCGMLSLAHTYQLGEQDLVIDSVVIRGDSAHFKIAPPFSKLPLRIAPRASFDVPICFAPGDTLTHKASLVLVGECGRAFTYQLSGKGASGLLKATDVSYPATDSGDVVCDTVHLKNVGSLPLVLHYPVLSDSIDFAIDPLFLKSLPLSIAPGSQHDVVVCFTPKDHLSHSATILWKTNAPDALAPLMKQTTLLNGKGYSSGAAWSPTPFVLLMDSTSSKTMVSGKVELVNGGTLKNIIVKGYSINGPDSSEFAINSNEFGTDPPFPLRIGDSVWVQVDWTPDKTQPFFDRNAFLTCVYDLENSGTVNATVITPIVGHFFGTSSVPSVLPKNISAVSAYTRGRQLVITTPDELRGSVELSLYDLLGRKVFQDQVLVAESPMTMAMPNLASGVYVLRLASGGKQWSCKVSVGD